MKGDHWVALHTQRCSRSELSFSHTHTHVRRNIKNTHTSLTLQLMSGWGYCKKKNITAPQKLHKNFIERLPAGLQTDPCEVSLMVINRMLSLRDGQMKTAFFPSNLPSNRAGQSTAATIPPPSSPPRSAAGGTGEECEGSAPLSAGVSCLGKHAGEAQPGSGLQGIYRAHRSASSFNSASTWGGGVFAWVRPLSDQGQTWVRSG